MIKYFTILFPFANLSSAHSLCFYRIAAFEPVYHIEVVNMLFSDMISAKPYKIIPVAHLVFHFSLSFFTRTNPYTIVIPPCLHRSNITNHILTLKQFAVRILIMPLQSYYNV